MQIVREEADMKLLIDYDTTKRAPNSEAASTEANLKIAYNAFNIIRAMPHIVELATASDCSTAQLEAACKQVKAE